MVPQIGKGQKRRYTGIAQRKLVYQGNCIATELIILAEAIAPGEAVHHTGGRIVLNKINGSSSSYQPESACLSGVGDAAGAGPRVAGIEHDGTAKTCPKNTGSRPLDDLHTFDHGRVNILQKGLT
jgi:hypothetical protein